MREPDVRHDSDGEALLPGQVPRPSAPPNGSARHGQIVAAAARLLEAEGPEALTMRRLADALGIQAPSLYKHVAGKDAIELALITQGLWDIGASTHAALAGDAPGRLGRLAAAYRRYAGHHPSLYRLATQGRLRRDELPEDLEEWAGNPWYVVTGEPALAQALWSFAHGMVILEIDGRYPPGSDLDATWAAGLAAFESGVSGRG